MTQAFSENPAARADMLALLCIALRLPTREVAEGLIDGSFRCDLRTIASELGLAAGDADTLLESYESPLVDTSQAATDTLRVIRREYTRLFSSPDGALVSPYESVFKIAESGKRTQPVLYISNTAREVSSLYRDAGLAPSREYRESADHIASEMFFMHELELRIMQGEEPAQMTPFVAEHFATWAPAFFKKSAGAANEPFYQAVCSVGAQFAREYALQVTM